MRVTVVVNDALGMKDGQTTTAIGVELVRRGLDCGVAGVADLGLDEQGRAVASVRVGAGDTAAAWNHSLRASGVSTRTLGAGDLVLLRTNPGRGGRAWAHAVMLELMRAARDQGAVVLNDPDALARARTKLFLRELPVDIRPRTLVSRDPATIRAFLDTCPSGAVLKPLDGTQGRDVFRIPPEGSVNLPQIVDLLTREGHCMAQAFVPEATRGDVRMIIVGGALLTVDGFGATVRRVPGAGDFRSNVHVGGRAQLETPSPELLAVAARAGRALRQAGVFVCGLDVIGTKVVEANVYAPGGLTDASAFCGVDFVGALVDRFLAHAEACWAATPR